MSKNDIFEAILKTADSNKVDKKSHGVSLLLDQGELLAETVKQYLCLFDKTNQAYKERDVVFSAFYVLVLFSVSVTA